MRAFIFIYILVIGIAIASDCQADKDFLILQAWAGYSASYAKTYQSSADGKEKDAAASKVDAYLFQVWLMYAGPCKFPQPLSPLAEKLLNNIRAKYSPIAAAAPNRDDPLIVLPGFDKGVSVARQLPNGSIPNFDAESISTKADYTKLVAAYRKWSAERP